MTIEQLLARAVEAKASDLHLYVGKPPVLRVDGELAPIDGESALTSAAVEKLVSSLLSPEQRQRFQQERELDLAYQIKAGPRFRVNLHWEKGNPGLAARVISESLPTMEQLGLPPTVFQMVEREQGLILVTGPTGCGKSTTLASMINQINQTRAANIVTFEDPIEYLYQPAQSIIRQRQLGSDFLSFPEGLKRVLRQDPDVILVGEMRDLETIAATVTLAETGHLVLATLHTNSAAQTVDRIVDVFPAHLQAQIRLQLASTLIGVLSQRLLPKAGGGRTAVRELLVNNAAVANIIREAKTPQLRSVIQTSADQGMFTMEQDVQRLLREGLITEETAQAAIGGMGRA